jgi:hypothetical protein
MIFFSIFLDEFHKKKFQKHYISTKLNKGFRLVYKLSYLVGKKILVHFDLKGGDPYQKKLEIFFFLQK